MLRAREALTQRFGRTVPDAIIDEVLRNGDADIGRDYVDTIREAAAGYAAEIMRRLREHEYDPQTMRLWVVGGGGCLLRHFGEYERERVTMVTRSRSYSPKWRSRHPPPPTTHSRMVCGSYSCSRSLRMISAA